MDQHSARTLYVAYISSDEYPTFRRGLPADDRLPETYEEWVQRTIKEHAAHRGAGYHTEPVVVHWDDLIKRADRLRLKPTYSMLVTLAIHRGRRKQ